MKCEELEVYEDIDDYIGYDDTPPMMYEKSEVDAAIEELKDENAQLKKEIEFMHSNCKWNAGDGCARLLGEKLAIINENVELKRENRKLKRALWLARATCAQESQYWGAYVRYVHLHENSFYEFINDDIFRRDNPNNDSFRMWSNRWRSVERKCRAKAEEYK